MEHIKEKIALGVFIFSILVIVILFFFMFQGVLIGKVVEETKEQTAEGQGQITCSDSDNKDYYIKGAIDYCDANGCSSKEDFCSDKKLTEWYCENSEAKYEEIECEDGCSKGVCLTLATKYKYTGGGGGSGGASGGGTTGGGGAIITSTGQTYNLGELTSEQTLELSQYDSASFSVASKGYMLSLTGTTETKVTILYEGSELSINVGEENNNISGIYLKLKSINIITNKAKLSLGLA